MNISRTFVRQCITSLVLASFVATPFIPVYAATDLEVSGWIPYWTVSDGTKDATAHLDELTTIHPFVYALKSDGSMSDLGDLGDRKWKNLFKKAKKEGVLVIPTITTANGDLVHKILSDSKLRKNHIKEIVALVKKGKFDGVDINYEGKMSATKIYFSIFLTELKKELGSKMLTCAIESRTPPESLYRDIPTDIAYANDLKTIGVACDRVHVMTYDQQRADILLNDARKGAPYIPVADSAWVRKVIAHMLLSIPKEKLSLGVATYGHEFEVIVAPEQYSAYNKVGSRNPDTAVAKAKDKKVVISRNAAGELSYTYMPAHVEKMISKNIAVPKDTLDGNIAAAKALAFANQTGMSIPVYVVWWSDAEAIAEKVELAEEFGLRGISIFKIDGHEDQKLWNAFE